MGDLSPHFSRSEFRCPCLRCRTLTPRPSSLLVSALEDLRRIVGHPLHISSGERCFDHNQAVGGSPESRHLTSQAADVLPPPGWSTEALAEAAELVPDFAASGIGIYHRHVHVDVGRKTPARWRG